MCDLVQTWHVPIRNRPISIRHFRLSKGFVVLRHDVRRDVYDSTRGRATIGTRIILRFAVPSRHCGSPNTVIGLCAEIIQVTITQPYNYIAHKYHSISNEI